MSDSTLHDEDSRLSSTTGQDNLDAESFNNASSSNSKSTRKTSKRQSGSTSKAKSKRNSTKSANTKNKKKNNNQSPSSLHMSSSNASQLAISAAPTPNAKVNSAEFKKMIHDTFKYQLKELDFSFIKEFYVDLHRLNEIWSRIGFNKETKSDRLEKFYTKLTETYIGIIESEEDLEENIIKSIESKRKELKELCFELQLKYDDLKCFHKANLSILEENDLLRVEHTRLQGEKQKRLKEYKQLANVEIELCEKLCMKQSDPPRLSIPSEAEMKSLEKRIKQLETIRDERRYEMIALKEEIVRLFDDLELSRSDSFAESIIFESADVLSLGEEDLKRASEFRDELRRRDQELVDEIRSLRVKIRELWLKLNIENLNLKQLVMQTTCEQDDEVFIQSKRTLVAELRKEYEHCVKIKLENMQKFIESVRVEIRDYCQRMLMSDKEVKLIGILNSSEYNEELLNAHEKKLDDLKFMYEESSDLYEKAGRWMQLWTEFVTFEEKTKDPMRFKTRGYSMLEEEKQRKQFNNQLPKLEEDLHRLASEHQEITRREFTINGLHYSEYIERKKCDHEASKMNERKEKQIMRDNIKKNESRYGSKPMTPLALRSKRKQQETMMQTPNQMRHSKLQKTEQSTIYSPAGLHSSKLMKSKLKARKSRTPGTKKRRSKIGAAANATNTGKSNLEQSTLLKTTTSSSTTSSMLQSTSNLSKASSTKAATSTKCPPLSSSAKYQAGNKHLERMTSTASNTFIEEEMDEMSENAETNQRMVATAVSKISRLPTTTKSATGFQFQQQQQQQLQGGKSASSVDVNYLEFTRELQRPFKFGTDSTNMTTATASRTTTTTTTTLTSSTRNLNRL